MPKNIRGDGKRILVKYTLAVTAGEFVLQDGFHGIAMTTQASGEYGWLNIVPGELEVTISSGQTWAVGTKVYLVGSTAADALTSTPGSNRLAGKVTRATGTETHQKGVPSGKVWMLVLPNNL